MLAFNVVHEKRDGEKKRGKNEKQREKNSMIIRNERNVMWFDRRRIAHERKTERTKREPETRSILDGKVRKARRATRANE